MVGAGWVQAGEEAAAFEAQQASGGLDQESSGVPMAPDKASTHESELPFCIVHACSELVESR